MRTSNLWRVAFSVLFVLLCSSGRLIGQTESATVSGLVTDATGAVVPGAEVRLQSVERGTLTTVMTNDVGIYVFASVRPGQYQITARKAGFKQVDVLGLIVNVQDHIEQNFRLQVGSVSESVTVEGGAAMVNTTDASVSTIVDRQFVENIPLNGRSFQSLITLTPGVVLTPASGNSPGQFSVNGQRANSNYFTVDGVSANFSAGVGQNSGGTLPALGVTGGTNTLVSVDALQEFRIQTSTYSPEFGRQPGAQIQIVTRAGTNQFNGTLFDYFRNDGLDANDWFANSRRLGKAALRQNDFGGVLGGPIIRNRTFFFVSYEGLRLRQPRTLITLVPSLDVRQRAAAGFQPLVNAYPKPNGAIFSSGFAEFAASFSDPTNLDATSIRIDHSIGSKITLFGRYNYGPSGAESRAVGSNSVNSLRSQRNKTQTLTIGSTQSITQVISNDLRVNYSRNSQPAITVVDDFGGATAPQDSLLFPSVFGSRDDSLFTLFVSGGVNSNLTAGASATTTQRQLNLVDNLSVITGHHQVKFGVDYRRLSPSRSAQKYNQLIFLFGLNDAINGVVQFGSISTFDATAFSFDNLSLYAQDTWRASRRLTVNYGLRWELNPAPSLTQGPDPIIVLGVGNPATATLAPPGTPFWKTTHNNFAPRLGLAYQLSQRQGRETVLRGGFGVFYDLGSGLFGDLSAAFPYRRAKNVLGVPFPVPPAQAAPPALNPNPSFPQQLNTFDGSLKLPYSLQWNVAVEQSLGEHQTLSASYVAAVGRRLLRRLTINSPNPVSSVGFFNTVSDATSDYHAMQLQFQRRLSKGLQALASYTWSHSIDDASDDVLDSDVARGPSIFDVRHSLSGAVTYDIPTGRVGGFGKALLRDWSVATIFTARSALPVDLIAMQSVSLNGMQINVHPDLIAGIPLYLSDPTAPGGRRLNDTLDTSRPGCKGPFCTPPAGRQGTLARNALRGFGASQLNLALRRQFNVTERVKLQLRFEAFNILNHPNFANPINNLTSPLFGKSTQMLGQSLGTGGATGGLNPLYQIGGPRSIQFVLRLLY